MTADTPLPPAEGAVQEPAGEPPPQTGGGLEPDPHARVEVLSQAEIESLGLGDHFPDEAGQEPDPEGEPGAGEGEDDEDDDEPVYRTNQGTELGAADIEGLIGRHADLEQQHTELLEQLARGQGGRQPAPAAEAKPEEDADLPPELNKPANWAEMEADERQDWVAEQMVTERQRVRRSHRTQQTRRQAEQAFTRQQELLGQIHASMMEQPELAAIDNLDFGKDAKGNDIKVDVQEMKKFLAYAGMGAGLLMGGTNPGETDPRRAAARFAKDLGKILNLLQQGKVVAKARAGRRVRTAGGGGRTVTRPAVPALGGAVPTREQETRMFQQIRRGVSRRDAGAE